ncbi:MAG: hypothetical protein HZB59_04245 [Ignavibacteriales bacterium]|nr:hypothetical protein [Ignavibacteriales bacterium]
MIGINSNISTSDQSEKVLGLFILGIVIIYGFASFFPDSFMWGINHLAFLPVSMRIVFLLIALSIGFLLISRNIQFFIDDKIHFLSYSLIVRILILSLIAISGTAIFYSYRIRTEMYGDTLTLLSLLSEKRYALADLFDLSDKEPLTRMIHQSLSSKFGVDQKSMFQIVSAVSGGIFLVLITVFIVNRNNTRSWKLLALIVFFFAGANQLFFGHVEDYTLVYLAITVFLILAWNLFDGKKVFGWMIIVFLIGSRLHIEMILLLPALLYAGAFLVEQRQGKLNRWLKPRNIMFLILASMVGSFFVYLFYFDAYRYSVGDQKEIMTKIFLPVVNPLQQPHSYSLISLNHFSDVIQQLFFIASPALVLLTMAIVGYGKNIRWKEPRLIFSLIALFYFIIFNFTINPMLSMPRDWDMLSPTAAAINFASIAITFQLFKNSRIRFYYSKIIGAVGAAAILSGTLFIINADEQMSALRLEGVGKWVFKSYYNGSTYIINMGEKMMGDSQKQIEHREQTIKDLLPYTSKPDLNISMLYYKLAVLYYQQRDFENSGNRSADALQYDSQNASALKTLGLSKIQLKQFDKAINLFSFYNKNINNRDINDAQGMLLEESARLLAVMSLKEDKKTEIQNKLDEIYRLILVK